MRKRVLTTDELNTVAKLRVGGASWLMIQKETGIPRYAAKRAYEDMQRSQSLEQFKQIRINVASEEFREHLKQLTRLAESLVDSLSLPTWPREERNAEQVLDGLWSQDFRSEIESTPDQTRRPTQRVIKDTKLLFKSLQEHTGKAVHWKGLEDWKSAWDRCIATLSGIREEAGEILSNILRQEQGLQDRITGEPGQGDALVRIKDGVVEAVWRAVLSDKPHTAPDLLQRGSPRGNYTPVIIGGPQPLYVVSFEDQGLADRVTKICKQAATILGKGDRAPRVLKEVRSMKQSMGQLEDGLSALKLIPVLLQTRCDLCPV